MAGGSLAEWRDGHQRSATRMSQFDGLRFPHSLSPSVAGGPRRVIVSVGSVWRVMIRARALRTSDSWAGPPRPMLRSLSTRASALSSPAFSHIPWNICLTQWGYCDLLARAVDSDCICLTAQNQQVPGRSWYYPFPIQGPVSPHLRLHTSRPQTIRTRDNTVWRSPERVPFVPSSARSQGNE